MGRGIDVGINDVGVDLKAGFTLRASRQCKRQQCGDKGSNQEGQSAESGVHSISVPRVLNLNFPRGVIIVLGPGLCPDENLSSFLV